MGGDLWGTGETVLPKIWGGGRPMHPSPHYFENSVVGCARMYEQSKKRCHQGIIFWNRVFSHEERVSYTTFRRVKIWKSEKDRENLENTVGRWLKKGHQKFWAWKWEMFPKKRQSEFRNLGLQNLFPSPPNSALGLRLCQPEDVHKKLQ